MPIHRMRISGLLLMLLLCFGGAVLGQIHAPDRFSLLGEKLDSLSQWIPALNEVANVEMQQAPLYDFVRILGKTHEVNVFIDNSHNELISNSFKNEPLKNIFLFICQRFDLDIHIVGNILFFKDYVPPPPLPPKPIQKIPQVIMEDGKLSFDLQQDSLHLVIKKISQLTDFVLIPTGKIEGLMTGFVPPAPPEIAIQYIFQMNDFLLKRDKKHPHSFLIHLANPPQVAGKAAGPRHRAPTRSDFDVEAHEGNISIDAKNVPMADVLAEIFAQSPADYLLMEAMEGSTSLSLENTPLEAALRFLLQGTDYDFKMEGNVYLIGKKNQHSWQVTRVYRLKYRPSDKVLALLPKHLSQEVEVVEYVQLNRLIITGDESTVAAVMTFFEEIDRPIPMVKIELLVVDVNLNNLFSSSVKMGRKQANDSSIIPLDLLPGLDYELGSDAIKDILTASGMPYVNYIDMVPNDLYLQIKALEQRGNAKVLTRPVISTLNGEEASLTIGETQYFKLQTNTNSAGTLNNYNQTSETLMPISYNTTLTVKPFVADDGYITVEVSPNFSSPGPQADPAIPPDVLTREFSSTVRVRNGETVVLGGLSRDLNSHSSEGFPLLSRIPVLRLFFGQNSRTKNRNSLMIYITPTVSYQ